MLGLKLNHVSEKRPQEAVLLCLFDYMAWWRHQMETFSALLAFCAGNSPVTGEFPSQRPMMRSYDVIFELRFNKALSKQSWGSWFETLSHPLWRHCNGDPHCDPTATLYAVRRDPSFHGIQSYSLCCNDVINPFNALRPEQNCQYFAGDILKYIYLNENCRILIKFLL